MPKNYSKLLTQLELTSVEKKALEDLKTIPRYHISWPRGYEDLMPTIGRAHAKLALVECLKEAKNMSETLPDEFTTISLRNAWFFSFEMFNNKETCHYAHRMDYDLFCGLGKDPLRHSFNNYISNLFGTPIPFEWNGYSGWIWSDIAIQF